MGEERENILESLPNELLVLICKNFDDALSLRAVSATSKRLHSVANPILYSLAAKKYPDLLCWACEAGEVGVAKKLLAVGLSPNLPAIRSWDERTSCYLYGSCKAMPSTPDVHRALYNHLTSKHEHGLCRKVYSNICEYSDRYLTEYEGCFWFPLHCAAMAGSIELVRLLVDSGAHLDAPSKELCNCARTRHIRMDPAYWTPLHVALCCRNEATANLLLELGASPNVEYPQEHPQNNIRPSNALHWAAASGFLSTIRLLLEGGLEDHQIFVDVRGYEGYTPLMWSLGTANSLQTMECLLAYGADLEAPLLYDGLPEAGATRLRTVGTAVLQACAEGWYKDAFFLIKAGAVTEHRKYSSALESCIDALCASKRVRVNGDLRRSAYRLKHPRLGHSLKRYNRPDLSEEANFEGMIELIKCLIRRGANIHGSSNADYSLLIRAAAACVFPVP